MGCFAFRLPYLPENLKEGTTTCSQRTKSSTPYADSTQLHLFNGLHDSTSLRYEDTTSTFSSPLSLVEAEDGSEMVNPQHSSQELLLPKTPPYTADQRSVPPFVSRCMTPLVNNSQSAGQASIHWDDGSGLQEQNEVLRKDLTLAISTGSPFGVTKCL